MIQLIYFCFGPKLKVQACISLAQKISKQKTTKDMTRPTKKKRTADCNHLNHNKMLHLVYCVDKTEEGKLKARKVVIFCLFKIYLHLLYFDQSSRHETNINCTYEGKNCNKICVASKTMFYYADI